MLFRSFYYSNSNLNKGELWMTPWLQQIMAEAASLSAGNDIAVCPVEEGVGKDETVLGILPDSCKRLYVVLHRRTEEMTRFMEQSESLHGDGESEAMEEAFNKLVIQLDDKNRERKALLGIFWQEVFTYLEKQGLAHDISDTLCIRGGWQIASRPDKKLSHQIIIAAL